jgi:hypothetical protein
MNHFYYRSTSVEHPEAPPCDLDGLEDVAPGDVDTASGIGKAELGLLRLEIANS